MQLTVETGNDQAGFEGFAVFTPAELDPDGAVQSNVGSGRSIASLWGNYTPGFRDGTLFCVFALKRSIVVCKVKKRGK